MKTEDKRSTADVLTEKPIWIKVGKLRFKARPLTLAQIYEMGAIANDINADGLQEKTRIQVLAELIAHHNDAKIMGEVFIVCLFRSRFCRTLFRPYIKHRLTITVFQQLMTYIAKSFNANFFLTSIIFLRQTTTMTEPKQMTAHGQLSEE